MLKDILISPYYFLKIKYYTLVFFINEKRLNRQRKIAKNLEAEMERLKKELEWVSMSCPNCQIDMVKCLMPEGSQDLKFICLRCKFESIKSYQGRNV